MWMRGAVEARQENIRSRRSRGEMEERPSSARIGIDDAMGRSQMLDSVYR
jgi:hypothetical protein